jgi:hypothetical protein
LKVIIASILKTECQAAQDKLSAQHLGGGDLDTCHANPERVCRKRLSDNATASWKCLADADPCAKFTSNKQIEHGYGAFAVATLQLANVGTDETVAAVWEHVKKKRT